MTVAEAVVLAGVGALVAGTGWLLMWVARRAAAGTLGRNEFAGIRTRTTLSSDAAWRAAHVAAEKDSVRAGQGAIVGGVLGALFALLGAAGVSGPVVTVLLAVSIGAATVWMLVWTLRGAAVGHKAAARVVEEPEQR